MNLHILSRSQARKFSFSPHGTTTIISINDSTGGRASLYNHPDIRAVCSVIFDDIIRDEPHYVLISDENAMKIKEFVNIWWDKVDNFVVHCYAGISRSSGCMSAVCRAKGIDDSWIWNSQKYVPNITVARTILRAFGIDNESYEKMWQDLIFREACYWAEV